MKRVMRRDPGPSSDRDRGRPLRAGPSHTTGMRVRTGRFEEVRSGECRHAQGSEVGVRQHRFMPFPRRSATNLVSWQQCARQNFARTKARSSR